MMRKAELNAQVEWLAQKLAGMGAHPESCKPEADRPCPDGGCAVCWRRAAEAETAGAGTAKRRARGNPMGAAAFGERSRLGAAEGRTKKADDFAGGLAGIVQPMQAEGLSYRAIAERLNGMGKRTRLGCEWQANSVKRLLDRLGAPA